MHACAGRDKVTPWSCQQKYNVCDTFIVMEADKDMVIDQKLLHSLSEKNIRMMSKEYFTRSKILQLLDSLPLASTSHLKESVMRKSKEDSKGKS